MTTPINTIIFDLGNVLINWDPSHVFHEKYFDSSEKREQFFAEVCTMDWNELQDEGRSIVQATRELVQKFPEWESAIRDYYGRWTDMLGGPINGTVDILRRLKDAGHYKIYALTNWNAALFDVALVRYDFLDWFDGRVVSGEEKTRKPFAEFYNRLLDRYNVNPAESVFIDDNLRNINAAKELGMNVIHFHSPSQLEDELNKLQVQH
jgi:2-haloacid dehalogenase